MFDKFRRVRVRTTGAIINAVVGGEGPPLLLLHGYPQTHVMWHKIAPDLARRFTVVATDLRGYGDSSKPPGAVGHAAYSKRAMAQDQVETMAALGFDRFQLVGHDRGARVAHRLALDYADRVERLALMDIVPTLAAFEGTDQAMATAYFHWFFLIQPDGFPERLIGADPRYYLESRLDRWGGERGAFSPVAFAEYLRCFSDPACIHATCEDYRAAATIDLAHDRADPRRIQCPLLVLWGARGFVAQAYDVLAVWRRRAADVRGHAVQCGHFLPEEKPRETLDALMGFLDSAAQAADGAPREAVPGAAKRRRLAKKAPLAPRPAAGPGEPPRAEEAEAGPEREVLLEDDLAPEDGPIIDEPDVVPGEIEGPGGDRESDDW